MGYLAATEVNHLPLMVQERVDQLSADNAAGARDQGDVVLLPLTHGVSPERVTATV